MANHEQMTDQTDFPIRPLAFKDRGIEPDDVVEFSTMYQLGPEDTVQELIDLSVNGKSIGVLQKRFSKNGVTLTRREAAHLYYDQKFLNRTIDAPNTPTSSTQKRP